MMFECSQQGYSRISSLLLEGKPLKMKLSTPDHPCTVEGSWRRDVELVET
jgi:hypothetical protein